MINDIVDEIKEILDNDNDLETSSLSHNFSVITIPSPKTLVIYRFQNRNELAFLVNNNLSKIVEVFGYNYLQHYFFRLANC